MKPNIGLDSKSREGVVDILNTLLSDEYVLYTKTRNFHWNVVGMQFNDLHKFFDAQYAALNEVVDQVAERARSLGGKSLGSLKEFLANTRLKESVGQSLEAEDMLSILLSDHESVIQSLRKDVDTCADKYQDQGTTDFLTGLMEEHEKMAWMLRSFLEKK